MVMCEVGRATITLVPRTFRHSLETSSVSLILSGLQVLTPWAAADAGCRPWRVLCLFIAYSNLQPQSTILHVVHGVCVVCLCGWTTLFTEPPNFQLRRASWYSGDQSFHNDELACIDIPELLPPPSDFSALWEPLSSQMQAAKSG